MNYSAPIATGINVTADRLNPLQFLTIRQFLSLVFGALVILLLVLLLAPLFTGFVRKVKAMLLRRQGPPL
jgi:hypothetical protein